MTFDIEMQVNCASFTPSASPVCAGCPSSEACHGTEVNVMTPRSTRRAPAPAAPARLPRVVLSLRHPRRSTITIVIIEN